VCRQPNGADAASPAPSTTNDDNGVVDELSAVPDLSSSSTDWPDCWSNIQYQYFKSENSWLCVTNKKLRCTVCADVKSLNCYKTQGINLSPEWIEGTVSCYGGTRSKQQVSLRKKISLHKESEGHKRALMVTKDATCDVLSQSIAEQQRALYITTERVFRTAYSRSNLIGHFWISQPRSRCRS